MKYVYKFISWILFEFITFWFGVGFGIKWLDKKRSENTEQSQTMVIQKTETNKSDRYKRSKVGFSYDDAEG